MNSVFRFKNVNSDDFNILIEKPPNIPFPEPDEQVIEIPGRHGVVTNSNKRFKPVDVTYSIAWLNPFRETERYAREIKAWLLGGVRYAMLEDTYDSDYFRKGRFKAPADIEDIMLRAGKCTAVFNCHPFKYLRQGQSSFTVTKSTKFKNPEMFESRPYLKVFGKSGEVYINSSTLIFKTIDGYTEIDSEARQAFKGIENKNNTVQLGGDFPVFLVGENIVQWSGNITKIEIIPRWCTI